jgi:hypothetical protein
MIRNLRLPLLLVLALLVVSASIVPATAAPKGTFSIGGNFGTGVYSNSDLNDALDPLEEVTSGWEYGGSLRYQLSEKLALDLEGNLMNPSSTTPDSPDPDIEISTPGLAIPLSLYYTLSENDQYRFNLFGGAGIVSGPKVKATQDGEPDQELKASSSFYGQGGLETQWMVSPQFALSARALGRIANSTIDDTDPAVDIQYGGFAFGIGARISFGGGQ